jgi:hypothetical protein
MQSVPITTHVESSNPTRAIQHVIKFISDLRQVDGFLPVLHDISEILLKVALNTIKPIKKTKYTNDSDPSSFIGLVEGPIHQPLINFQNLQFQIDKRLAPGCMISSLCFLFFVSSFLFLYTVFPSFSFLFKCSQYSFSATLFANYPCDRRAASFI